ncbi:hypothetical protein CROQUDRAFT_104233 [Cronartium quercuum f. sp. fusiforme G11]|uniref:FAD-binding FR-type domain-containing protein n=1 Tax=Cronartium quercuum f. sp. fusiforme G11 TaxID=708437 RepID=A0A9P6NUQ9_9BASI|nr:hypothetical protein CROQUDRAFT_104233 [Cronartium quercuum f. sp. fusiforme G11]
MSDAPPAPPSGFTIYDSYTIDPLYAHYFTYTAISLLALAATFNLLGLFQSIRSHTLFHRLALTGFTYTTHAFHPLPDPDRSSTSSPSRPPLAFLLYLEAISNKLLLWSPSLSLGSLTFSTSLTTANILMILTIPIIVLSTLLPNSDLSQNANRAGFIALATIPWLFLLGGKSTGLSTLIGKSYDQLNFLHRYLGRFTLGLILVHFGIWTKQFFSYGRTYGNQMMLQPKSLKGIMSLCFLILLSIPSISWIRHQPIFGWRIFKFFHVIGFIGLMIGINMHTIYAWPWTVGVIVIYAVDVSSRAFRYRFKRVQIDALEGGITRLRIEAVTNGWRAGQHIRLRLFFPIPIHARKSWTFNTLWRLARPLESHPLTIAHAPASTSVAGCNGEAVLLCRAGSSGGWASDVYAAASTRKGMSVSGLVDGPYGGLPTHTDLAQHAHLLLVIGGSGMSFGVATLDEAVSLRSSRGIETISVIWCVRDSAVVGAYLPMLESIIRSSAPIRVQLTIHLSQDSETDWAEKSDVVSVLIGRCSIADAVCTWIEPDLKDGRDIGGGRTVVVCGPNQMVAEVRNTVARVPIKTFVESGGISVYSEQFAL